MLETPQNLNNHLHSLFVHLAICMSLTSNLSIIASYDIIVISCLVCHADQAQHPVLRHLMLVLLGLT